MSRSESRPADARASNAPRTCAAVSPAARAARRTALVGCDPSSRSSSAVNPAPRNTKAASGSTPTCTSSVARWMTGAYGASCGCWSGGRDLSRNGAELTRLSVLSARRSCRVIHSRDSGGWQPLASRAIADQHVARALESARLEQGQVDWAIEVGVGRRASGTAGVRPSLMGCSVWC